MEETVRFVLESPRSSLLTETGVGSQSPPSASRFHAIYAGSKTSQCLTYPDESAMFGVDSGAHRGGLG
eukprot:1185285-Prorocentrum_minimum.AAC.5